MPLPNGQVYVEAERDYRTDAKNVREFYVRNANNDPVPLDAIATIKKVAAPEFTLCYNEYRAAQLVGGAAPGYQMKGLVTCKTAEM